ncbi:bacteriohemerythrin [Treponema zioleckii]|uniref:bacteriohemerythrin n=1 Tax=Treponema zioleckii TaxID=331680 RepID=UPI00168A4D5B|nr:bacteriohemerythrin [Treponema zioleckii]
MIQSTEKTDFIKWNPSYKTGIPVIDEQHEHLVNLCNDFYKNLLTNKGTDEYKKLVKETLDTCVKYAATHFQEEEKLMIASNFSGYNEHKHSHDVFKEKCQDTCFNIDDISVAEAIKFAKFLYEWIHNHIAHEDKLYIPTLKKFLQERASK